MGLAAAAKEEQRQTALGASHVVTVTPGDHGHGQTLVSKIAWRGTGSNAAPWTDAIRTRQAGRPEPGHRGRRHLRGGASGRRPRRVPADRRDAGRQMRYGWDLEPAEHYLYVPDGRTDPVGMLVLEMPTRDNLHLVWVGIAVHPDHRRRRPRTVIMNEALRLAREAGRSTIWVGAAEDDQGARRFVEGFGFRYASHDARRRQVLADVDHDRDRAALGQAEAAASDYRLERLQPPDPGRGAERAGRGDCGDQRRADGRADLRGREVRPAAAAGHRDGGAGSWGQRVPGHRAASGRPARSAGTLW